MSSYCDTVIDDYFSAVIRKSDGKVLYSSRGSRHIENAEAMSILLNEAHTRGLREAIEIIESERFRI